MPVISARRIIRHKGSNFAILVGCSGVFNNVEELIAFARKTKRVYAYVDADGNEGTIRSGRLMRRVDAHVKNTVAAFGGVQIPLDIHEVVAA
jgi:hypothetical protein